MTLYAAIDLHSNNGVLSVIDEHDHVVFERRLPNDLEQVLQALAPFLATLKALAVESTYNWYWLVDGLMDAGVDVRLVNTAAVPQYAGLKHGNDQSDARHLAHLLRLGILPEGYVYPRELRGVRDLLRRRFLLVRQSVTLTNSLRHADQFPAVPLGAPHRPPRPHQRFAHAQRRDHRDHVCRPA
jgi:transposase